MKEISWGFIGCGEVTEKKSGPAFNAVQGSHVEAVMCRSEVQVRSYAERHHIPKWYTDAQELIDDPAVNAIYIATPPSCHATYAIMAMRAGKPCYVEKPLAARYADCIRVNRISEKTGVPCFVAYYRRYLPYFQKVKSLIQSGVIGKTVNVLLRFSVPPRALDYKSKGKLSWRLKPDISGGGYFYDLAPHQFDLLQDLFGVITRAHGYPANVAHLYQAEDTISACFFFESGIPGSGSWCFVGHESAREDRIEVIGTKGTLSFSVFNYDPIKLITSEGTVSIIVPNPPYVQLPIIKSVIEDLQGIGNCSCTSISATPTNWVLDRILWKN
ncbi:MAG: Gfo/Idh/MocA family oxidoreductase [Prevotella sp.]|jgi:predicted dehydrogenase|nr:MULTISPECIES: Gfo/Idh/MocA family oxidoreductase [unclassified Prevotella]MCH3968991.1 Gfo/Idh/MocA family oxidoreductase [Prevotella sp.]MCH3985456.1 Gfo/Idh/MocA family oxidoreductase [Prevotella sp.]MCH3992165.1 Gfo/Idh/MocA family oxidoreductase [Prevotella sp.]MCH4017253.1 Gfo/Idh/MocA family oxidoreductase [Prevotella sp.]MCH4099828.1 Gfo/Idh/MocA family oxidoreductase [Prevotella sp.]